MTTDSGQHYSADNCLTILAVTWAAWVASTGNLFPNMSASGAETVPLQWSRDSIEACDPAKGSVDQEAVCELHVQLTSGDLVSQFVPEDGV